MDCDVIVVGAGLSGLAAAFRVSRRGLKVEVLEAGPRPGGVIGSVRRDGMVYETGSNIGLDTSPVINRILAEAGIRGERVEARAQAKKFYVLRDGRLVALPRSPGAALSSRFLSFGGKLRLLAEPWIWPAPAATEESVASFVRRRLGSEVLDYVFEPLVAVAYAGDPERLSMAAALPRLASLERRVGGLTAGALLGPARRGPGQAAALTRAPGFSFKGGMQTLTDGLARNLPVTCGARVKALRRQQDLWAVEFERRGETFTRLAQAVILAVPADVAARLTETLAPATAAALAAIPYAPLATVSLAYRRVDLGHPLDAGGYLAPRVEASPLLGCLFASSVFDGRAPADKVVLTCLLGGVRAPAMLAASDGELEAVVAGEVERRLGAKASPLWTAVTRWPRAIPQYTLGHGERIAAVLRAESALPGLFFCANYRGGVSMADCATHGDTLGGRVADWVRQADNTPLRDSLLSAGGY